MGELKKNCTHLRCAGGRIYCSVLENVNCLQCNCSFYETEAQYMKRQLDFERKHNKNLNKIKN